MKISLGPSKLLSACALIVLPVLFLNLSSPSPAAIQVEPLHGAGSLGVYVMGGKFQSLRMMREHMKSIGVNSVRLLISFDSANMMKFYGIDTGHCRDLACIIANPEISAFLSDEAFKSVALTTYDFSSANGELLDAAKLKLKRDAVLNEYNNFFREIARHANPKKKVIVANWEGDNQAFCGASYAFSQLSQAKRLQVCPSAEKNIWGLAAWANLRQEALVKFRANNTLSFQLLHAVEFNSIRHLQKQNVTSVLELITKGRIACDWASYSSYESLNDNRLADDLRAIKSQLGSKPLMIGEFGYSGIQRRDYIEQLSAAIKLLQDFRAEIPLSFIWQMYEDISVSDNGYALFASNGAAQMHIRGEPFSIPRAAAVRFTSPERKYVEIYGRFPHFEGSQVWASCSGFDRQLTVIYAGERQINVQLPVGSKDCRFRVISAWGVADDWTNSF